MDTKCNEPTCCRDINGPPKKPEDAAGVWGDYHCDLPVETAELMFLYVKNMHPAQKPDLVFWTGDNTPHDIWNQSIHDNTMYTIKTSEFLDKHMPEIPVVAVPGNHEFYPVNVMSFDGEDKILNKIGKHWDTWLDDKNLELFKAKGYFSYKPHVDHKAFDDVRVIGLNTQVCNNMNWHIWSQLNDPLDHMAWLETEFSKAEANNEKVLIMSHIPINNADCLHDWAIRYKALLERYQHIVRTTFYGHTHLEETAVN
jgi:sphingomyelin phosphodiesterase